MVLTLLPSMALATPGDTNLQLYYSPGFKADSLNATSGTMSIRIRDLKDASIFPGEGADKRNQSITEKYTIKVKGPDNGESEDVTSKIEVKESTILTVVSWGMTGIKEGKYTITVEPKDGYTAPTTYNSYSIIDPKSVDLYVVKVSFDDGIDNYGTLEPSDAYAYAAPGQSLSQLTKNGPQAPTVTIQESQQGKVEFVGWAKDAQSEVTGTTVPQCWYKLPDYDAQTYANTYPSNAIHLNAQYGQKPLKELKIQKDEQVINLNDSIELTDIEVGGTPTATELTLSNGGNQDIGEIYVQQCPNFLKYSWEGEESLKAENGYYKLPVTGNKALKLKLTPNGGLDAGTKTGTLNIRADSVMYIYTVKLNVTKAQVTLSWNDGGGNFTKTYGQVMGQSEILNKIKVDWTNDDQHSGHEVPAVSALGLVVDCVGLNKGATVNDGGYPINFTSNGRDYEVSNIEGFTTGKITVQKATPVVKTTPSIDVKTNTKLSNSLLDGFVFENPYTNDTVLGTATWNTSPTSGNEEKTETYQFTFKPSDTTNYKDYIGEASVKVSLKESPNLTLVAGTQLSRIYDCTPKPVKFVAADGADAITVNYQKKQADDSYAPKTTDAPTDAGTYKVTATVAENEIFAAAEATAEMTIAPKQITATATVDSKVYDGNANADIEKVHVTLHDVITSDSSSVSTTVNSATYNSKDAGYKTVDVKLGELTGEKASNYTLQASEIHANGTISKKDVTLTLKGTLTKKYGAGFNLSLDQFNVEGLVDQESLDSTYVVLTCEGVKQDAVVRSHDISVENHEGGNYTATISGEAKLTVEKGEVQELANSVKATAGKKGGSTDKVTITGTFVNKNNPEMQVKGNLEFDFSKANPSLEDGKFPLNNNSIEVGWKFTPTDNNYDSTLKTGTVTIDLTDKEPVEFSGVQAMVEKEYNGQAQPYTVVTAIPSSTVTYSYKNHVDSSYEHGNTSGETSTGADYSNWNSQAPTNAGMYDVLIVAEPDDTELYTSNSIVVHLHITAREPNVNITTAVEEGSTLGDVKAKVTGVKGKTVNGTFTWDAGPESIINENEVYNWYFESSDGNYGHTNGTAKFTFNPDTRSIEAVVYNLPGDNGNYAVVNVAKSGLKAGEILTFYKDSACTDPESTGVLITESNMNDSALVVPLDADALGAEAGKIYAKVNKTKFNPTELEYKAEPGGELKDLSLYVNETANTPDGVPDVAFEIADKTIVDVKDGKLTALKTGSTTITVTLTYPHPDKDRYPNDTITVTKTITVNVIEKSSGGGGGGGGGVVAPDNQTVTNPDGSKTTTVTNPDGTKTETTTKTDGVVGSAQLGSDGNVTSADVTIPSTAKPDENGVVTAPIEVPAAKDSSAAPEIDVKVQGNSSAKVEIPVTQVGPGTVAVVVHPDGTETVVRDCVIGENGVVLNVEGNVTLKIVDNTETFTDVEPVNHWATDAVEFVAARELFNGTGNHQFTPNGDMTRGMLVTVLYRLAYEPDAPADVFTDVSPNAYYADAIAWADQAGVVNGYGNNTFGPEDNVTREQMVTILYRYAQKSGNLTATPGTLDKFADAGSVSGYAGEAMGWAVEVGLIKGVDATHIAPQNNATRAEVATILMRFCENVAKL